MGIKYRKHVLVNSGSPFVNTNMNFHPIFDPYSWQEWDFCNLGESSMHRQLIYERRCLSLAREIVKGEVHFLEIVNREVLLFEIVNGEGLLFEIVKG